MFYKIILSFLFLIAPATVFGCISQWSNWETSIPCPDYCGGGFNATFTRICLNASTCPCSGPTTITKPCNQNVCKYPRNSCFGSMKALASNSDVLCTTLDAANKTDPYPNTYPCCPPQGIWGSWIEASCNDTCGGYGISNSRRRACLTEAAGCPCIGEATQTTAAPCNLLPCSDRAPCAIGLSLSILGGLIICVKNETAIKPSTCCPSFGVWEMWGSWSTCSTLCGGCAQATRTRSCASEKYGCPCDNSTTTETQTCNRNVCSTGTKCCTPLIPFTLSSGEVLCYPPTVSIPAPTTSSVPITTTAVGNGGEWSEWSVASCTASCGLCGRVIKKRVCQNGATCIGENQMNTTQICGGPSLCPFGLGLPSCCEPSYRAVVGEEFRCILLSK